MVVINASAPAGVNLVDNNANPVDVHPMLEAGQEMVECEDAVRAVEDAEQQVLALWRLSLA